MLLLKFEQYRPGEKTAREQVTCFHCGDTCPDRSIAIGEKFFCCHGCKTVFEILNTNELCDYYTLDENPGLSPKEAIVVDRFDYLDDPSVKEQVLEFAAGKTEKVTFQTPGMHCASCIWLLEKLHDLDPRVLTSKVNFPRKEVSITYHAERMKLSETATLLSSLGYEPLISLDTVGKREQSSAEKKLYLKIGVAGFAFGNVMILSFPEYLSRVGDVDPVFKMVFGYLSLILSLPVLIFAARDYYSSAWAGLKHKTINIDVPITLGVGMLFFRSSWEIITQTGAGYLDSFTGLIFFLLVGRIFQQKTYDLLSFERDYRSFFPLSITRKVNHTETAVPIAKLKPGDRIVVRNQELIPADSVLLKSDAYIDYSFVSGEADPVRKQAGEFIYAGGRQVGTTIELEVIKEPSQSYLTSLWNNDVFTKPRVSRLNKLVNDVSQYFTAGVLLIATVAGGFWMTVDVGLAVKVFTAVLIVACPCALALASPFALGTAMRIFGRLGFYVKNTETVEALSKINTVILDKTGTLTETKQDTIEFHGDLLDPTEQKLVRSLVKHSTHPLSLKIHQALDGNDGMPVSGFEEKTGQGISGIIDGHQLKLGSSTWVGAAEEGEHDDLKTRVSLSIDGTVKGSFFIANTYRKGIRRLLAGLRERFQIVLLSGDTEREKPTLVNLFGSENGLHFQQSPEDKLEFVREIREQGSHVMMVGDGLNDAGALRASEVGIAVTDDVSAFSPASDAILTGSELHRLVRFIDFSKATMSIIVASFIISVLYNVIGIGFAVSGKLSPLVSAILMPASSISVVLFTTFTTSLRARMMKLT